MKNSVQLMGGNVYKVTITSNTNEESVFLESPISKIKDRLDLYFDTAIKEKLGEEAEIESYINDSNLPYEVLVKVRNNQK